MNITKIQPPVTSAVQNTSAAAKPKAMVGNGVSSDQVQLSKNYQDLAQAQKAITGADQVRTEKVAQIKSQLESGNYQINPSKIAGQMLDEII